MDALLTETSENSSNSNLSLLQSRVKDNYRCLGDKQACEDKLKELESLRVKYAEKLSNAKEESLTIEGVKFDENPDLMNAIILAAHSSGLN